MERGREAYDELINAEVKVKRERELPCFKRESDPAQGLYFCPHTRVLTTQRLYAVY